MVFNLNGLFSIRTFSLRTGLILFIVLGVGFGFAGRWVQDVRERGEAQLKLVARSQAKRPAPGVTQVRALHPGQESPTWLTMRIRAIVHPEYEHAFETVSVDCQANGQIEIARLIERAFGVSRLFVGGDSLQTDAAATLFRTRALSEISFDQERIAEDVLRTLGSATELKSLTLYKSTISAPVAIELAQLRRLEELTAYGCTLDALPILSRIPNLKSLKIESLRHSAHELRGQGESREKFVERAGRSMKSAMSELSKNSRFESLWIRGPLGLMEDDLAEFCEKSQIKSLTLLTPSFSPDCLQQLVKLQMLSSLTIQDDGLLDEHLELLVDGKGLKNIVLGPNVSREAIHGLREKMPGVQISSF